MSNQAPKQPVTDELIGRVINDRFRVLSLIARGGMGRVYRAEQMPLGRLVAIKTLDPRHAGADQDPQFQQRFFLEASVASKLQHPNTVTVFDYGRTSDGIYFMAMELVEGRSLFGVVRDEAPLAAQRVVHIAIQIARSLREAHRLDVIHRDLKPGNVLLTRHGDEEDFVKVLDFGLVKHVESTEEQELTKAGLFMGSPKYMSPEQIRGERVDPRADVYALGVVMYEMLTGKVPFERDNTVKILMAHVHEPVPPLDAPGCPPALAELVMRCLEKRPELRPASMDEIIVLLKQSMGGVAGMSGQFQISREMRLTGSPGSTTVSGRTLSMTPSQTHTQPGVMRPLMTPSAGFSGTFTHQVAQPLPTTPAQLPMPAPAQSSWLPKLAVIGALGIAGGFLALRFSEKNVTQPVSSVAGPQQAPTAPSAAPAPEAPAPADDPAEAVHVIVTITSVPSGASITADGRSYGETPANIEWWGEQAERGREVTFTLQKVGFERVTLVRTITGDDLTVEAVLPRFGAANKRRTGAAEPKAPVVVPDKFKDDPY